jgi:hypothetical protein
LGLPIKGTTDKEVSFKSISSFKLHTVNTDTTIQMEWMGKTVVQDLTFGGTQLEFRPEIGYFE